MDMTYKTNCYQLPLLHVIGQATSNRSFLIAICLLATEDSNSYIWAVNSLKKHIWQPQQIPSVFITDREIALHGVLAEVFPDLQANLCTWHLNKDITTHFKKFFAHRPANNATSRKLADLWNDFMSLWGQVTCAKTRDLYFERFEALKAHLASRPAVLEYIETSIVPVKELFVVAWACNSTFAISTRLVLNPVTRISKRSSKTQPATCSQCFSH
jgi:hypothetical protein